jgi:hypothetical protein
LEAALALGMGRECWSHNAERTPFEKKHGNRIGIVVGSVEDSRDATDEEGDGVGGGSNDANGSSSSSVGSGSCSGKRAKLVQEVDLRFGSAPLWCEVKDSNFGNPLDDPASSSIVASLIKQLRRYRACAIDWQVQRCHKSPPMVGAAFTRPVHAEVKAEIERSGFLCVYIGSPAQIDDLFSQMPRGWRWHCFRGVDGSALPPALTSSPDATHRPKVVLDQGLLAILVADIWELTADDMATAGIESITLFNSSINVTNPEAFLKFVRPWAHFLQGCDVYACATAIGMFEEFLALRGSNSEKASWAAVLESRLTIVDPDPTIPVFVAAACARSPASTAPSIAAALAIDPNATVFTDQQGPFELLRGRFDLKIGMGIECKLRASYLREPVPGRKTEFECVGPCSRLRLSGEFSYRSRKVGQAGAAIECRSCTMARDVFSSVLENIFAGASKWACLAVKLKTRFSHSTMASAMDVSTKRRLGLLKRLVNGQKASASRRGPTDRRAQWQSGDTHDDRLAAEMRVWFDDVGLVLPDEDAGPIALVGSSSAESNLGFDFSFFG